MAGEMVTVEVHGLAELDRALAQLPQEVAGRALQAAVNSAARVIGDEAERLAPVGKEAHRVGKGKKARLVQPGNLKRGIRVRKLRGTDFEAAAVITVSRAAFYAKFVEFGVPEHAIPARPFLRPAFDTRGAEAIAVLKERLAKRIASAARRLAKEAERARR